MNQIRLLKECLQAGKGQTTSSDSVTWLSFFFWVSVFQILSVTTSPFHAWPKAVWFPFKNFSVDKNVFPWHNWDWLVFSRTALLNMRENRKEIITESIHSTKIAKFPTAGLFLKIPLEVRKLYWVSISFTLSQPHPLILLYPVWTASLLPPTPHLSLSLVILNCYLDFLNPYLKEIK